MKRLHIKLTGLYPNDTTHPTFMEDFKAELEKILEEKSVLHRVWVKEIMVGKDV